MHEVQLLQETQLYQNLQDCMSLVQEDLCCICVIKDCSYTYYYRSDGMVHVVQLLQEAQLYQI